VAYVKDFRIKRNNTFIATIPHDPTDIAFFYDDLDVTMGFGPNITYRVYSRNYSEKLSTPVSETTNGRLLLKQPSSAITPRSLTLAQNYPNPFNPETLISFGLPEDKYVSLNIYNLSGQTITTLVERQLKKGKYNFIWNGRNDLGEIVSSGIYIYSLKAGPDRIVKKLILMR